MRIVRRVAEVGVDLRLELLGERVLEAVRLGMDLVDRETQAVDEEAFEQPVVP
jgi:hypothetical protein